MSTDGNSSASRMSGKMNFKGGTCLKKCFFDNYRFSEDLDFTILAQDHIEEDLMKKILNDAGEWVYEQSGIELPEKKSIFQ